MRAGRHAALALLALTLLPAAAGAQQAANPVAAETVGIMPSEDYVIGPEDVLVVTFWREEQMSGEVLVRPDGHISLPLLNDVRVVGLTPDELRQKLVDAAKVYVAEPNATVTVKAINSRKVFITGQVAKPGAYPIGAPISVMQLISISGGFNEFAKTNDVVVIRRDAGRESVHKFKYDDVLKGKNIAQNLTLKPGDTVVVP